ncbi:GNAT family N-acetyltransferase [Paenibacillus barcinonensis]|uniref:Acetyltransferase (GNAT) family protein n=1 Tax=Paenibacillus barcinonensis TaxID=198119 RepID=A0A2V4W553_PAEBA|nr:GNAT family N-acetyltransferase [Paenibacillus barcinonensis]PYE49796.1 acetyltransferase (GNAT) family protein [Paenibacillus barcinonensis]QKS56522.1 GNAT family N-acetyltransferase [Paenibacillus barcinonensis]
MMKYRKPRVDELKVVARLNAESFADYPLCDEIRGEFNDQASFVEFLTEVFQVYIGAYYKKSVVFIGEEDNQIKSVAILDRPDSREIGLLDYFGAGAFRLFKTVSIIKVYKFLKILNEGHEPSKGAKKGAWFLESLAVDNSCRGQRLGSRMLTDCIIPYIKRESKGDTLASFVTFTNSELNRSFYTKNGFTEFDYTTIERNGKTIGNWSFKMSVAPAKVKLQVPSSTRVYA